METITVRGKKWIASRVTQLGISVISELPGDLIGGELLTEAGGRLQVYGIDETNLLLQVICEKDQQKAEKILPEAKRHQGICVLLEGEDAEGVIYHKPLDVTKSISRILEILETEFPAPWLHCHKFSLDTAKTNHLLDEFPSGPKFIYVKECGGTVTLKFDSQNEPSWTLAAKDLFEVPFQQLYLTWTAQAGKKLTSYVSNREIKRTTLA